MKVKSVGISPTSQQDVSLIPELLASVGAKYSRSNEGLESILASIGDDQEPAVDRIFKHVDYGHRSIADMVPVAIFLDDISMYLALKIWNLCPTAGGQESSTRYIKLGKDNVYFPTSDEFLPAIVSDAFDAYNKSYAIWTKIGESKPEIMGIPSDVTGKKLERMVRNFAFDRARYFLPLCCMTNVMMVMSARAWVDLTKMLYSCGEYESHELADAILEQLALVAPRLIKHGRYDDSYAAGFDTEFNLAIEESKRNDLVHGLKDAYPTLQLMIPFGVTEEDVTRDLMEHGNRYDYFGPSIRRISARFGWKALTIAELRDLNRHRTGTKDFNLVPVGSYFADDQIEMLEELKIPEIQELKSLRSVGETMVIAARSKLESGDKSFMYYLPIGAQCRYEHVTTADKMIYQIELRTGIGSHYLYRTRMIEIYDRWCVKFPETANLITIGAGEPE